MKFRLLTILSAVALPLVASELASAAEMKIFDWNGPVSQSNRGFPHEQPPKQNGNWVSPINYAQGTFHIRIEIRDQPVPQNMNLQFCFWQEKGGDRFGLESTTKQTPVTGRPGTVITTSQAVSSMWKKGGKSIEWQRPRYRNGIAIKTRSGRPVSNFQGWNWNGQDPKKWYPLDLRYTVVVVSKGSAFSGWDNYIDGEAPNPDPKPEPTQDPKPDPKPEPEPEGTIVSNGTFESGMNSWNFYTSGSGSAKASGPGNAGSQKAAQIAINSAASNIQLLQPNIRLKPNTAYRLSFAAYSNTGDDLRVSLSKHSSPYSNYGLRRERVDLTTSWKTHTVEFRTDSMSSTVSDGRLYFWFADDARRGDRYFLDNVQIVEADSDSTPEPEPEPEPDPESTPAPSPTPGSNLLQNGGFDTDLSSWTFYTNGSGNAKTAFASNNGSGNAALIALNTIGSNIQLLQSDIPLEPDTDYILSFAAYSNSGHDFRISLGKHDSPYTNYGLNRERVDLTTGWKTFSVRFTTRNLDSFVNDGRLFFWFASDAKPGDWYFIDQVNLSKAN